jgi:benzoate-CoA ligase
MNAVDLLIGPERIERSGDHPALVTDAERISYRELLARVNRAGHALRGLGVGREQRVVLLMKDTPVMVAAYLGTIKIGAVAVAVNVRLGIEDVAYILSDSRAVLVLADPEYLPLATQAAAGLADSPAIVPARAGAAPGGPSAAAPDFETLAASGPERLESMPMSPDDMAFWLYTSGTTGTPKASVHLHHDVSCATDYAQGVLRIGPGDRLFATSKLFFAYALGNSLFAGLQLGASAILCETWPDGETVAAVIDRHRPTVLFSVPAMYRNLLRDGLITPERMTGIRCAVSAGERLPEILFERYRHASGGRSLIDGIGASETIFMFLSNPADEQRPGAAGRPFPGVELELRDEQGQPLQDPAGPGVLWVRMPSVADRYWNQQEQSRRAFRDGWFRTGDLLRVSADGFWYHEGRIDDMLKISGQWVSPAQIEEHVLRIEGVLDAAITGRTDADGLTRLALFVVPATGTGAELHASIADTLARNLAVYQCPRQVHLVADIPRTATGKVQRFKLRELTR